MYAAWRLVMVQRITDLLPPPKGPFRRHWREATVAILCAVLFVMAWVLAAIFFSSVVGCCPSPVVKYVEVPTQVKVPCTLPPPVKLSAAVRVTAGCPEQLTCYDVEGTARIADRESRLKSWIKDARAACSPPPTGVSTQPVTR